MSVPLLATKLSIPSVRPDLVPRAHLLARIHEGLARSLFLVSAPAGSGKTTLVSVWARASSLPVSWLSLDKADNDPCRFLTYVAVALQEVAPDLDRLVLPLLQTSQPSPVEVVLTALINRISEMPEPFVLVLDDYHLIETPSVHHILSFLLEHLPHQMHLVLITRADPPLPLARLRARGRLAELRAADLSFSLDESAVLLNEMMGLKLTTDDVNTLVGRTEGWAVGLQLAALSMQGRADLQSFITRFTGSQEYIADFLTDEVLEQQPEKTKSFLLQTSILERMTGPLCDAVLNGTSSQSVLEELQESNLFLVSLDDERRWYRYHHLFAELLLHRLKRETPNLVASLHQRASEWFEQQGLLPEAIKHALDAQDFETAARLVNTVFDQLWETGTHTTLKGWLERLPDATLNSWPQLIVRQAMFHTLRGQVNAAETHLHDAEQMLDQKQPADSAKWQGIIACLRGHLAWVKSDVPDIVRQSQVALDILPEREGEWRSFAAMTLGGAFSIEGKTQQAGEAYEQALETARKSGNLRFILAPAIKLAFNLRDQGRLTQATRVCEENIHLIDASGYGHPSYQGVLLSLSGDILREWDQLDEALELARKGKVLGEQGLETTTLAWNYYFLIRVLIARQDFSVATSALQDLEAECGEDAVPAWFRSRIAELKIQLLLAQHDLYGVERFLAVREPFMDSSLRYLQMDERIQLARFFLMVGQESSDVSHLDQAQSILARVEHVAEQTQLADRLIKILALQSLVHQAMGNTTQAVDVLHSALALGEPEKYIRTFIDEGPAMVTLLRGAAEQGMHLAYIRELLGAIAASPVSPTVPQHDEKLAEPLSGREIEVLSLIAEGLTNREIAERLYIAPTTVKVHARNIFGKLGVHNRTQAVATARVLGLLP